jgi:hypothetical protein
MEFERNDMTVNVNVLEQSDDWLVGAATEIAETAEARGLELSIASGVVLLQGAAEVQAAEEEQEAKTELDTRETLTAQLGTSFQAYKEVIYRLNDGQPLQSKIIQPAGLGTVTEEFSAWLTDEKVNYVRTSQENAPGLNFTLVATPNIAVNANGLFGLAKRFAKKQPYRPHVSGALYSAYDDEQLSGSQPNNGRSVVFSLIPDSVSRALYGTQDQQQARLADLRIANPDLKVPSILENLTRWHALREAGDSLDSGNVSQRTSVRHFDLPGKLIGESLLVPTTCLSDIGRLCLVGSDADVEGNDSGILAVG